LLLTYVEKGERETDQIDVYTVKEGQWSAQIIKALAQKEQPA
jgi:hypothetical protein